MEIKYTLMTGCGNDFIIIDNMQGDYDNFPFETIISKVCTRGVSIGADGFIIIEQANQSGIDFIWRFYNSDGSIGEMCGNGARCAAKFAYNNGYAGKKIAFLTEAGIIDAEIKNHNVTIKLTPPHSSSLDFQLDNIGICSFVNTGVPHAVLFVDNLDSMNIKSTGAAVRNHPHFGEAGTNANFVSVVSKDTIKVRTYERGVENETLACGTGAAASAYIAASKDLVNYPVCVITRGGFALMISLKNDILYLEGEARQLSSGVIYKEAWQY